MGFSACPSSCALYKNYSRDCSFALGSHRTGHNGIFLVPVCILPFLYRVTQCPSRSVLIPTQRTHCAAAIYPAVVYILLGEILLLGCQLLGLGKGRLRAKGLRGGGCPKQLPFPLTPGSPRSAVPLCCLGSCPVSQLSASGRVVNSAVVAAHGALSALCCPWHHCSRM